MGQCQECISVTIKPKVLVEYSSNTKGTSNIFKQESLKTHQLLDNQQQLIRHYYNHNTYYEGEYKNGQKHGQGVLQLQDGFRFVGQWSNNYPLQGYETWPDGTEFEGTYQNGLKNGYGKIRWKDGSEYQGDFQNNQLEGDGIYYFNDGRIYEGQWKQSSIDGQGKMIYPNQNYYQGEFKENKMTGLGIYYIAKHDIVIDKRNTLK